jgi:hypothetical protein
MKKCSICKEVKNKESFPFQNKKLGKIMAACKQCTSIKRADFRKENNDIQKIKDKENYQKTKKRRIEYAREYRKKYPERTRATNWKSKYGISTHDFYSMLNDQDGKCAICSRTMNDYGKIFCVDHDHLTGEIRGLLCDPCNYGLGFYEKHKDKYINYLKKNNKQLNVKTLPTAQQKSNH